MWRTWVILGVMSLLNAACSAPFLYPVANPDRAPTDDGLVGDWISAGDTVIHAAIVGGGEAQYAIALTVYHKGEFKTALALDMSLVDIGTDRYADLFLNRPERDKLVGMYGFLVIPMHQVLKISRSGDELRAWMFDPPGLEASIAEDGTAGGRARVGGDEVAVVTALPEQARALIARHAQNPAAFGPPIVFRRIPQ